MGAPEWVPSLTRQTFSHQQRCIAFRRTVRSSGECRNQPARCDSLSADGRDRLIPRSCLGFRESIASGSVQATARQVLDFWVSGASNGRRVAPIPQSRAHENGHQTSPETWYGWAGCREQISSPGRGGAFLLTSLFIELSDPKTGGPRLRVPCECVGSRLQRITTATSI
jgi:hypothetical protein